VADLIDAALDVVGGARALDNRGVVLIDADLLGAAKIGKLDLLELDAEFFHEGLAAGQDGDVFEHRLATIAEAGSLDGGDFKDAAELVDDERREGFAFDVLSDDEERCALLGDAAEKGDQVLGGRDLPLEDKDVGVFEDAFHRRRAGDEVRGEVALVELHALDEMDFGVKALAFFDGDNAVLTDLVHRLGDDLTDGGVLVGGAGANLGDLLGAGDGLGHVVEFFNNGGDGGVDAALHLVGVGAGGDVLQALGVDCLGIDGSCGGAVASFLRGPGSDFLDHLSAHVFVGILEFDLLGDGDAVLGDGGSAEGLLEDDDAARGAEGDLDGLSEFLHATKNALPGVGVKVNLLRRHKSLLSLLNRMAPTPKLRC